MQEKLKCPKCGEVGYLLHKAGIISKDNMLKCKCEYCNEIWDIPTGMCAECGKPNYYAYDGTCIKCYQYGKAVKVYHR